MKKIGARIVADSICDGRRITSMIVTIPQIVVKELLRHRMFSFSSSSMRAIPFNKVLSDVKENMFVPSAFQSHHTGMQGQDYLSGEEEKKAREQWISSGLSACDEAEKLYNLGVTKQLCSRIIEPYGYATILITATEWENFFELRTPKYELLIKNNDNVIGHEYFRSKKDFVEETGILSSMIDWYGINKSGAEIHIQELAESMWDTMNESVPKELKIGEWHTPFGDKIKEGSNFDYKNTRDEDIDFHKEREMFIVKDNELHFAPKGTPTSHTEYFGDVTGIVRGFKFKDSVYTYIDNFIPIESNVVSEYFKGFNLYAGGKDFFHYKYGEDPSIKIAVARCARLSFMTYDGEINYKKDIDLFNNLLNNKHLSPMEHVSCCRNDTKFYANFCGWQSYRNILGY